MKLAIAVIFFLSSFCNTDANGKKGRELQLIVKHMVKLWSEEIGVKLTELSRNMTREAEVEKSFVKLEDKLIAVNGAGVVRNIANKIRIMMDSKAQAVRQISEYAEFLSYHRRPFDNTTYYYFDADNITDNDANPERQKEVSDYVLELECHWMYDQKNLSKLPNNTFSNKDYRDHLFGRRRGEPSEDCDYENLPDRYRPPETFTELPMEYVANFDEKVNTDLSIAKIATNVYEREPKVLEGLRWSEALDLVFKDNYAEDPTLTWQYFASPRGFMRHYPAVKWSEERYDQTYDFRTRTWYTEAITSPKDIIILLDKSGSMKGTNRALSMQIVNQILDTLNDNDFVNVYTFSNTTEPLVDCFNDTLVQANEENLRLLRENLPVYKLKFAADLYVGFEKAFEILENFRATQTSARCNQAVMIITEGIDYFYDINLFKIHNQMKNFSVRIFTYQIGDSMSDARELEWIACANMGYWANITDMGDIREKMLNYLNVMSRPINYNYSKKNNQQYIWSYLHVDLADRRLSNWLWKKYEGIRQRAVFLDHMKRLSMATGLSFTSPNHALLMDTYTYEKYETNMKYKYMTTVSLPVYGRRKGEVELIGVAGVDVPISLFKAHIPFDKLGVNGYAFIVTNNGYILMHPDHRTQFKTILKPTFNRVDFVEVEILNDDRSPRMFGDPIVKLREKLVNQKEFLHVTLDVKYSLHEMKRLMLATRHYFYAAIGPFTLGIVLPDKYGFVKVDKSSLEVPHQKICKTLLSANWRAHSDGFYCQACNIGTPDQQEGTKICDGIEYEPDQQICKSLLSKNWKAHPDWIYCPTCKTGTPEEKVGKAFCDGIECNPPELLTSFLHDLVVTKWFEEEIETENRFKTQYIVHKVFLATHSGLFRWKTLTDVTESDVESFEDRNSQAIDEDWYRRAVEINFNDESIFLYSVPFQTSGYENNTMITSTKAIFVENENLKTPVAVVGLQFNHRAMYELYNITTKKCIEFDGEPCGYTCESDYLNCFILDNNAYVVLSDEPEFIGRYMGDIRPYIMSRLTDEHVYVQKRMYDYQAICQKIPPPPENDTEELRYRVYESTKKQTKLFEKLAINKTFPTPCDHEMWLYNINENKTFPYDPFNHTVTKFECDWPFVVDRIPNTNLLFLAINGDGSCSRSDLDHRSPEPLEILYNPQTTNKNDLPCYIATMNNYTRRMYMGCYNRDEREDKLRGDPFYCGHYWK